MEMKRIFIIILCFGMLIGFAPQVKAITFQAGDLIKGASFSAVYYYGEDGKRYVFPNEKVYYTWYANFLSVKEISDEELAVITIGGNVTYRPGIKMVKIQTDPKVYAVAGGEKLRWIKTEQIAKELYGDDWNKQVYDVEPVYFINYEIGDDIVASSDFKPTEEAQNFYTIELAKAGHVVVDKYTWDIKTINDDSYAHKELKFTDYTGSGFLATWYDDRNGQNEVYFNKVDDTGAPNGAEVRVSDNVSDSRYGIGREENGIITFLWEDYSINRRAIYSQRFDLYNNELSRWSTFTSSTFGTSRYPDFAWNENLETYGVVWWDTKGSGVGTVGDLYFSKMTTDAKKSGANPKISSASHTDFKPRVVARDRAFGVVWQDGNNIIKFALVDEYSALSGEIKEISITNIDSQPEIIWNGTNFGVVWTDTKDGINNVYFALLDSAGNTQGDIILVSSNTGDAEEPSIAWSGEKFYVSYTDYTPENNTGSQSDIFVAKVNANGVLSGTAKNISNSSVKSRSSRLAVNKDAVGIVWIENDGVMDKIFGATEEKISN